MSTLNFLLGGSLSCRLICPTWPASLLVNLSRRELPSLLPRKRQSGPAMQRLVVSTLAAALSRWKPFTLLRLQGQIVNHYHIFHKDLNPRTQIKKSKKDVKSKLSSKPMKKKLCQTYLSTRRDKT